MRTQLRVGVVAAVLLGTAALAPTPAFADAHPPRLTSAQLQTPQNAPAGGTLTIAWSAEDDAEPGSGVQYASFAYEDKDASGNVIAWANVGGYYLPLGDGRSLATGLLSAWAGSGHYALVRVDLQDQIGNWTQYTRDGSITSSAGGGPTSGSAPLDFAALDFDVSNPLSDTAAPVISGIKPLQRTVLAGQPIVLTSTVRDDVSGLADISVSYTSPSGATVVTTSIDTALAPAGLTSVLLPLGAEGGHWRATHLRLQDRAGNRFDDWGEPGVQRSFGPPGIDTFADQPPTDFASLDIDVTPVAPDGDAPVLANVSREGPAQLHRGDDVVMHYALQDASSVDGLAFSFRDVTGHSLHIENHCLPEGGTAVDQVLAGLDSGRVTLEIVSLRDELGNQRQYRRDGSVWTVGRDQPDAVAGIDLSAFDFDLVDGAASYTGRPSTRLTCHRIPKLPLTLPGTASVGQVIAVAGQVLNAAGEAIAGAPVAVFQQPSGQDTALVGLLKADDGGNYSQSVTIQSETTFITRFLGRSGSGGADPATSEPRLVRVDGQSSASPSPSPGASTPAGAPSQQPVGSAGSPSSPGTPGAGDVVPFVSAPSAVGYGAPVSVSVRGTPGAALELWAYSRPSTTYRLVRTGALDASGRWSTTVRPASNTRLFVMTHGAGDWLSSPTRAVQIRTAVSLRVSPASSTGRRTFAGTAGPALAGRLVSIYRTGTTEPQLFAQVRTTSTGAFTLTAASPRGSYVFDARTAATDRNAVGISRGIGTS